MYNHNWMEWPACERPGYCGGLNREFERTRWAAANAIPSHLVEVFFNLYTGVEDAFSHSFYGYQQSVRGPLHRKRRGYLKRALG